MQLQVDPSSPLPLYAQVMEQLRVAIASGVLRPGDRLPGIREAAERAAVNPMTVVRAYQALTEEGWLAARQGLGTFVASPGVGQGPAGAGREEIARGWARDMAARALRCGLKKAEVIRLVREALDDLASGGAGSAARRS
ncbi:MAG: GntR family transcriptional regulator [Thermoanaerobaculia bacterium]